MGAATEAVIELLDCGNREGRRLLAMKGAQPKEVGARFLEFDDATNDLDDVDACQQVLDECLRDQRRSPASAGAPFEQRTDRGRHGREIGAARQIRLEQAHNLAHILRTTRLNLGQS